MYDIILSVQAYDALAIGFTGSLAVVLVSAVVSVVTEPKI